MTLLTKGMGAVIKKVAGAFKSRGKKPAKWMVPKKLFKNPPYKASKEQIKKLFEKKGVVDRNIESKKAFKIMNKGKN